MSVLNSTKYIEHVCPSIKINLVQCIQYLTSSLFSLEDLSYSTMIVLNYMNSCSLLCSNVICQTLIIYILNIALM